MPSSYTSTPAPAQRKDSMTAFAPIARKHNSLLITKILFATLLTLALFTAGYAQTLDKAKLDQFFDRLAEKNKVMGSLTIAKDGNVLYRIISTSLACLERLRKASGGRRKTGRRSAIRGQEQWRQEGVSEEARTTCTSCLEP